MNLDSLIGQKLDGKYLIERELGRGGMGAVYLANHIGTDRSVALKVIVPQFMQKTEFVERFRREAKAAGRLRHPNVVDVTDFGFAETSQGRVAYLVMEYLDGCTLGEILDEEKQLPLSWTVDILEQVCSAVHEAHTQGIIHRDLKPDNIWLEPNQRGGYTVKVLDFGIAKLEESIAPIKENLLLNPTTALPTQSLQSSATQSEQTDAKTIIENRGATVIGESGTLIQNPVENVISNEKGTAILPVAEMSSEDGTAIFEEKGTQLLENDENGTRLISTSDNTEKDASQIKTAELTRVGAVLGTPLYMSPEQCRGEKLTSRSDIYSLAVIAYQMLSGKTPFGGDFTEVMTSHKEIEPPPLDAKKVPKKIKEVLFSALSKKSEERPPTAEAFANKLRSHSEGFGKLLQRALVIYSEHLPKFLLLSFLLGIPYAILSIIRITFGVLASLEIVSRNFAGTLEAVISFISFFVQTFFIATLVGTVTWIVSQSLAAPLREISLKKAFRKVWAKRRNIFLPVTLNSIFSIVVLTCCLPLGIYFLTVYMLITPVIIMEDLKGKAAFRRSKELVKRSFVTALAIGVLMFFVPAAIGAVIGASAAYISKEINSTNNQKEQKSAGGDEPKEDFNIKVSPTGVEVIDKEKSSKAETDEEKSIRRLNSLKRRTTAEIIMTLLMTPIMILLTSLASVITALMYFKTRQAGGESMQDLLAKFEDSEHPQRKWQHRIRERLIQSGRANSTERK